MKSERIYYVGGVNAAGKSTLIDLLSINPEFEIVHGTARFIEWLGLKPGDYNSMRKMPYEESKKQVDLMWSTIIKGWHDPSRALLLDTHYLNLKWGKVTDVTGDWIRNVTALFLITADVETLLNRISKDPRDRALFPEGLTKEEEREMLSRYMQTLVEKVESLAQKHNLPYFIIENKEGQLTETVKTFLEILKTL